MKINKVLSVLVIGLSVVACSGQQAGEADVNSSESAVAKSAKDYLPSRAEIDSVSYLVGVNFGSFLKAYNFGEDLNYSEITKGIKAVLKAEGNFQTPGYEDQFKHKPSSINNAFNAFLDKRANYLSLLNKEKGEAFLAKNASKAGVQTTESGLQYEILEPGSELKPAAEDTVWVNYKGSLLDGTVFDETPEGGEPIQIVLTQVIRGWQEGLQLVGEGGKIKLYIPSDLGYGAQGNQAIEPNSTLIFDVTLAKVAKAVASEDEEK